MFCFPPQDRAIQLSSFSTVLSAFMSPQALAGHVSLSTSPPSPPWLSPLSFLGLLSQLPWARLIHHGLHHYAPLCMVARVSTEWWWVTWMLSGSAASSLSFSEGLCTWLSSLEALQGQGRELPFSLPSQLKFSKSTALREMDTPLHVEYLSSAFA